MINFAPSRREWVIVILLSAVIVASTFIPLVVGSHNVRTDRVITGIGSASPSDTYTYLAWIEQAREGHLLLKQLYSSEPQVGALFHPLFLVLGGVGTLTHFSNMVVYQGARAVIGFLFFIVAYRFICCFFDDKRRRLVSFLLLATSSGLGFLFGPLSTDLWMTEAISYVGVYQALLNTFALTLMLGIFTCYIEYQVRHKRSLFIWAIVLLNILTISHTYDWVIVFAVLGLYSSYLYWRHRDMGVLLSYAWLLLFSFPAIFVVVYALLRNPVLGIWANYQSNVPAPAVNYYILGYGLIGLFALVAVGVAVAYRKDKYYFLIFWLVASFLLIYAPFLLRFQRKFGEGLHIPLSLLAAVGITAWVDRLCKKPGDMRNALLILVIFFLSWTNIYMIGRDAKLLSTNSYPYSMSRNDAQAMQWLKSHTRFDQTILSGYRLGNLIPGITGRTVYMGHYDQTVDLVYKYRLVPQLMTAPVLYGDPLRKFAHDERIAYIVVDEEARSWGVRNYEYRDYLELVYKNEDVEIYKVK